MFCTIVRHLYSDYRNQFKTNRRQKQRKDINSVFVLHTNHKMAQRQWSQKSISFS